MSNNEIRRKAKEIRKSNGGKIFAFPISEEDPFSKYAIVVETGKKLSIFPERLVVEEVAQCILVLIDTLEKNGIKVSYEQDVKFMLYDAQINSPSITMKKLRSANNFNYGRR